MPGNTVQTDQSRRAGSPHPVADVLTRSVRLAGAFRARDLPVVLVRVTAAPDGSDATPGRTERSRPIFPRLGETGTTAEILDLLVRRT